MAIFHHDPLRQYFRERVIAEANAALNCHHPKAAAAHVDLATRYLKMFNGAGGIGTPGH